MSSKVTPCDYSIISHPGTQWRNFRRLVILKNNVSHWKAECLALCLQPPDENNLLTRSLLDLPSACLERTTTATTGRQGLNPICDLIKGCSYQSCIFSLHTIKGSACRSSQVLLTCVPILILLLRMHQHQHPVPALSIHLQICADATALILLVFASM